MEQTIRLSPADHHTPSPQVEPLAAANCRYDRLRLVILQETPGFWLVRGLEHDVIVEGRSIGTAVRAAVGFVEAHTAFDRRHDLTPLSAFPPSPSRVLGCVWRRVARGAQSTGDQRARWMGHPRGRRAPSRLAGGSLGVSPFARVENCVSLPSRFKSLA